MYQLVNWRVAGRDRNLLCPSVVRSVIDDCYQTTVWIGTDDRLVDRSRGTELSDRLLLKVSHQAFVGLMKFEFVDNVVAVEHASGLVAEERHRRLASDHVGLTSTNAS